MKHAFYKTSGAAAFVAACALVQTSFGATAAAGAADSFSLEKTLGTPEWFDLGLENTTRYESLDNQFRPGYYGSDQILLTRSLLSLGVNSGGFGFNTEFIDCRQELADTGTRLTSSIVDTTDILQAYATATFKDVAGGAFTVNLGRRTVDMGSRRFVARQAYRLTINSFDGVDVAWKNKSGVDLRAFYYMPVNIRPTAASELLDDKSKLNESSSGTKFYGVFTSFGKMPLNGTLELYSFFLNEKDTAEYQTANQDICTPGFRYFRKAAKEIFDYEVEAAFQFGTSYSSTKATDTKELDNSAWMTHLALGYTFDAPWKPRISAEYDYASGDDDPTDGDNNHFNGLYGVARGDLGPTSIYGAMSRTNINSPALRLTVKPVKNWDVMLCDHPVWLASKKDSWAGVVDKTGASGDYVGNQIEGRVRWEAIPGNLKLEAGFAYLTEGEFMKDAPNSPDNGDPFYSYVMVTISM